MMLGTFIGIAILTLATVVAVLIDKALELTQKQRSMAKAWCKSQFDRVFLRRYTLYLWDGENSCMDLWAYSKDNAKKRYWERYGFRKKIVKVRKV